jgi:hypothetical protein
MSNCKTCSQEISWDQKKREALHIRGPVNLNGTIHQCITKHSDNESVTVVSKEDKIIVALENLTASVNALTYGFCASTEQERNIARGMIVKCQ